jgi:dTDP-4-amino-4,6-dideoxygalactose transaminase
VTVPFLDLGALHASIRPDLDRAIDRVISSSGFVGGAEVVAFEEEFGAAHGTGPGAGCGSGTDALALTMRALGIGPGDEVIVPSMTFVATAEAVVHVGATPVIADVDPRTLLLSQEAVQAVMSERVRAVVPVHLYGHVVPFGDLAAWRDAGLLVIEDAAQAHLATWAGRPVGEVGHAACFSFYPGKNLGALGDGGMVISTDERVVDEVRRVRDHGRKTKYEHETVGWCSRLDGLQAAVLRTKLEHLTEWTKARRELASAYADACGDLLVPWEDGAVHHLLVARLHGSARSRADIAECLKDAGIATGIHYPVPLSEQPSMASFRGQSPIAELAATEILSLPMCPTLPASAAGTVARALFQAIDEVGSQPPSG